MKIIDWNTLVDEIYYEVKHVEPWTPGATKTPSTAFCLLLRLFTIRCSEKQMKLMLNHADSPYIRCIGFLYLRFTSDPFGIWQWFEPYIYDDETVRVQSNLSKPEITIGEYVRSLITEMDYYGTLLPRLPSALEREMKVKLLQAEQIERRGQAHLNDKYYMDYFQNVGSRVRAMYGDDEHPIAWYDAVVDRVITRDDDNSIEFSVPKFVVTFPEYGNTELVTLGEIDKPRIDFASESQKRRNENGHERAHYYHFRHGCDGNDHQWDSTGRGNKNWIRSKSEERYHSKERHKKYYVGNQWRGYCTYDKSKYDENHGHWMSDDYCDHGYERKHVTREDRNTDLTLSSCRPASNEKRLMEEVLRREREKCAAKGKAYASRPATFKESIAITERGVEERNICPSPINRDDFSVTRETCDQLSDIYSNSGVAKSYSSASLVKRKTPEELAALEEKKRKLIARYG